MISKVGATVVKPRIYKLKAYSYFKMNDFANAKLSIDEYFKKVHDHDIVPKDYEILGDILASVWGSEDKAYINYEKAMNTDSIPENKAAYLQKAVDLAKKQKDKAATAYWLTKQYNTKKNPSNVDLYYLGRAYMDAGTINYSAYYTADSVFKLYTEKYPDQHFGYYWRGRANWSIDTSMINAMANPHFTKFIELATPLLLTKDSIDAKGPIKIAYKYFIGYNIFIAKDYKTAIEFCDKILAIDPSDKEAGEYKRQLTGGKSQTSGTTTTPTGGTQTKPATTKPAGGAAPKKK